MSFRIVGLPAETFAGLFSLSDEELKARRAVRRVADSGGYPCRVSLTDRVRLRSCSGTSPTRS